MRRLAPLLLALSLISCDAEHEIADALDGLRWELPCLGDGPDTAHCTTDALAGEGFEVDGLTGATTLYSVTVRVRGEVEQKTYENADHTDGCWAVGGTPRDDDSGVFALEVSHPPQVHYLNAGTSGADRTWPVDVDVTFDVSPGAQVEISATDGGDGLQVRNRDGDGVPQVIEGVPPDPDPYDGQFLQMDVLEVIEL